MIELKFKEFMNDGMSHDVDNKFSNIPLDKLPLAMSYTPMQSFCELYNDSDALMRGTLFAQLDKPFRGKFTGGK